MITVWCLTVAFVSPWVVGAPILWLCRGCRRLRPADWLWAPFVGLAVIVSPLQSLAVFADLPLARTVPLFWLAALSAGAAFLAHRNGRASLRFIPRRAVLLALAVYLGQGVGVVVKGVQHYRGCLESDQYQYVVLAQFLTDEPFSTGWEDVGDRPWLVMPVALKSDRIGQSVVHGFFAQTAGRDALDLFYPTQLLGPGLMVLAVYLLAAQCGLSRRWTCWAAVAAALAPGTEFLVTNCFLSHSLCMPALVAFLGGVIRLARGGGWRPVAGVVATFALGLAVYTEFAPLFVGAAGAALAAGLARRHIRVARVGGVAAALALALALNPAATRSAAAVAKRGAEAGTKMATGCRTAVWVASLWLHAEKAYLTGRGEGLKPANLFVYAATGLAVCGAVALGGRAARSGRRLLPALAPASLVVPPVVLWCWRPECEYVLSKLVLTLAPVMVLFLACAAHAAVRRWPARRRAVALSMGGFLVMLAVQSGLEQRARQRGGDDLGGARAWNDADMQRLCEALRFHARADVVIALPGDGTERLPAAETGAVCYYARHHRIRLAAPGRIWMTPIRGTPAPHLIEVSGVPPGALVVRRRDARPAPGESDQVVGRYGKYELVRTARPDRCAGESGVE